jgi:putative ribosome biogenesis GTPase RsgA
MKTEFEEWAHGRILLAKRSDDYANQEAQTAWEAWQRAWKIAVQEQRFKDEREIDALKNKVKTALTVLSKGK